MLRSINSTILLLAILFGSLPTINAQDDSSYAMWENIILTPDNTKLKALGESMRAHNMKYHASGTHEATVFSISSGPNAGKIVWSMGPVMFKHLDSRPAADGHDEDWRDSVMPYIKKMNTIEYWSTWRSELHNLDMLNTEEVTHPIMYIRYWEVNPGNGFNIGTVFEKVSKAVKAMEGENPWGIYVNEFNQGKKIGRHFATISFHKNWTDFDEGWNGFRKSFEATHGENSWMPHINMRNATFANWWDEIWVYDKNMSGK